MKNKMECKWANPTGGPTIKCKFQINICSHPLKLWLKCTEALDFKCTTKMHY